MPYSNQWVDPEVYIKHRDVIVYHLYDNDCIDDARLAFWYTTDPEGTIDGIGSGVFDVRTLDGWTPDCDHAVVIRAAIDRGDLPFKEDS